MALYTLKIDYNFISEVSFGPKARARFLEKGSDCSGASDSILSIMVF